MTAAIRHRYIGLSCSRGLAPAPRRRTVLPCFEALEPRLALSVMAAAQQDARVIQVGASGSAQVDQLLAGSFALKPLASQAGKDTAGLIVNAADLSSPGVLRLLKRDYQAGDAVALVNTTAAVASSLASKLGLPPVGDFPSGVSRAELIAFRKVQDGAQALDSTSVLLSEVKVPTTPAKQAAGQKAVIQGDRAFLDGIFTATPAIPAPPQLADSAPNLLDLATAYKSSVRVVYHGGETDQIVDTVYDARSFLNQEDLYYVDQEIDVESGSGGIKVVTGGAQLASKGPSSPALLESPEILQPSPQPNPGTTTITTGTEYNIGGSVGWSQESGFNAEISGGATFSNSTTTEVPPIAISYTPILSAGSTRWEFSATNQAIGAATFYDSWIWAVPFKAYAPNQTSLAFLAIDGAGDETADLAIVPLPFGRTFQLSSPTVSGVSARSVKPGQTFTITGSGLYPWLVQSVSIGGQPLSSDSYQVVSDSAIQVDAPNMPGNALPVVVKTTQGFSNTNVTINIKGTPELKVQSQAITAVEGKEIAKVPVASFTDSDPDATAKDLTATITWGDGHTSTGTITPAGEGTFGVLGTHIYARAGTYTFDVQVTEGDGSGSNTGTATVAGRLHDLVAQPVDAVAGQAIANVPVASFTDSDPHAATSDLTATITWGDGNTSTGTIRSEGKGTFEVLGTNTYAAAGTYGFSVQVTGRGGSSVTAQGTATVSAGGRLQDLVAQSVDAVAGQAIANVPVASFTDSDRGATTSDFTAAITWGDGNTSAGTITSDGKGTFDVLGTNTYAKAGTYSFSVQVTVRGGSADTAQGTATVSAAAGGLQDLVAQRVDSVAGQAFTNVTVATFTDPDASPSDFAAAINWGDGITTSSTTVIAAGPGTFDVLGTHTYVAAGNYTFTVQVSFSGGSSATVDGTATVTS